MLFYLNDVQANLKIICMNLLKGIEQNLNKLWLITRVAMSQKNKESKEKEISKT